MKKRLLAAGVAAAAAPLLWAGSVFGQAGSPPPQQLDRFERQLERIQRESRVRVDDSIPPTDRAQLEYGGYFTFSYLSLDDPAGENRVLRRYELVGFGRLNLDGAHELFARARTTYNDFNPGDAFDGRGDDWESPIFERFHYRFDLQRALAAYNGQTIDWNLTAQGGRQLVTWGNGLVLSEVIDGGVTSVRWGPFTVDGVAGVTFDDVVDFDVSRPDFREDTHRGVYGLMVSARPTTTGRVYAYGLVQRDYNGAETSAAGGFGTRFDYNSHYIGIGADGSLSDSLLYAVEAAYEGGSTLSNSFDPVTGTAVRQTREDIQAFALDGRLDYLFADRARSRLSGEVILATGDRDRVFTSTTFGGNRPGTDDHAFNALGLLNTGLAFTPAVSNLMLGRIGASTFPLADAGATFRQLQVGADVLVFGKFYSRAPIDEPTDDRRYLGTELDLYLNWQVLSDVTLAVRYGAFFPGSAIRGDDDVRQFLFAGLTYAF